MYIDIFIVTSGQLLYVCNILDRFQLYFDHLQVPVGSSHTDRLLEYHDDKRSDASAGYRVTQNSKDIKVSSTRGCLGLRGGAVASGTWRRVVDPETSASSDLLTKRHTPELRLPFTHSFAVLTLNTETKHNSLDIFPRTSAVIGLRLISFNFRFPAASSRISQKKSRT